MCTHVLSWLQLTLLLLLLLHHSGAHAALTRRHLQQTMAGREARANDAAVLTAVTINRALSDAPPRGVAKPPTKGPAATAAKPSQQPPVTITTVTTTAQGTPVRSATFAKPGPVVGINAATTIGVKTTTNVGHPTNNAPVVGNKGGNNAKAGNMIP
jgi:hypothetical protein